MSYTSFTENRDAAYVTTGNSCLDFFTRIVRNAPVHEFIDAFVKAWNEDKSMAYQILMNLRDVRNGKGEKLIPVAIMVYLKNTLELDTYEAILRKMVEYGYWKDLLKIVEINDRMHILHYQSRYQKNTAKQIIALSKSYSYIETKLFAEQLQKDMESLTNAQPNKKATISLCSKWAPTESTHYDHFPICMATFIRDAMNLSPKEYRKMLTKLRGHLSVLEMLMANQRFDEIDFSKIPSVAMRKWKNAFNRDTNAEGKFSEKRKMLHLSYQEFLTKLAAGQTKVNVKGIQPHELVGVYMNMRNSQIDTVVEGQWTELVKRTQSAGVFSNTIAIVDVSGSMSGLPMQVSVSLGILVAMCTTGPYHGKIIPFSDNAQWFNLPEGSLMNMVQSVEKCPGIGTSTNLRATFDLILREAKEHNLSADQMIKTIIIFTDMQFNQCDCDSPDSYEFGWMRAPPKESTLHYGKRIFQEAGYQMPRIVCWNLRTSNSKSLPTSKEEDGVVMLSGFSAELLKCVLAGEEFSPMAMLKHILEPYDVPDEVKQSTVVATVPSANTLLSHLNDAVDASKVKTAYKGFRNTQPETDVNDPMNIDSEYEA